MIPDLVKMVLVAELSVFATPLIFPKNPSSVSKFLIPIVSKAYVSVSVVADDKLTTVWVLENQLITAPHDETTTPDVDLRVSGQLPQWGLPVPECYWCTS